VEAAATGQPLPSETVLTPFRIVEREST